VVFELIFKLRIKKSHHQFNNQVLILMPFLMVILISGLFIIDYVTQPTFLGHPGIKQE
jgi:hypothetical protein